MAEMDYVIGIDPGVSGGLACLTVGGDVADVEVMPTAKAGAKTEVSASGLAYWLRGWTGTGRVRLVAVERVHAMPKQGVSSMFNFGMGYGVVRGVVGTLGLPLETPTPQAWMKVVHAGLPPAKDTKTLSVYYCGKRFPGLSLRATPRSRVAHTGIADAVCIAEWARRMSFGHTNGKAFL